MSVTSRSPEHQLMAFWAPFLLLHLGGQDNITAYSIEDNRLWLRHLQIFVVQVLAAAYVLYESSIVSRSTMLRPATILMFVVGVLKYGERVWALNCASSSTLSGKNYQSFGTVHIEDPVFSLIGSYEGSEDLQLLAHRLSNFPKHLLKGPLPLVTVDSDLRCDWKAMYQVAEMQLSLMYDVFYSKAVVIHTWYGLCIRVISPLATVAAFLLFRRFSEKDGYSRVDVAATYVLLVGAVVLEIKSVLRAMLSSWQYRHYTARSVALQRLVYCVGVDKENPDHIQNSRGRAALKRRGLYEELGWSVDIELDESILVWHIATHAYLGWYEEKYPGRQSDLVKATEALSNYMMFLLAARPYMLPDNASRQRYIELCNKVINHLEYSSAENLLRFIREHRYALNTGGQSQADTSEQNITFDRACKLAAKLISKESYTPAPDMLELIAQMWVEMLCYAGYRCRADSHARQLSNGGEITTVVALLVEYLESGFLRFEEKEEEEEEEV